MRQGGNDGKSLKRGRGASDGGLGSPSAAGICLAWKPLLQSEHLDRNCERAAQAGRSCFTTMTQKKKRTESKANGADDPNREQKLLARAFRDELAPQGGNAL